MSYTSISAADPWPDACPPVEDLSERELLAFLEDAPFAPLSNWEREFCLSIERQLLNPRYRRRGLSKKQAAVFNKGLLKVLWENDPALWEGIG